MHTIIIMLTRCTCEMQSTGLKRAAGSNVLTGLNVSRLLKYNSIFS